MLRQVYLRPRPKDPSVTPRFVPSSITLQWVEGDSLRDPQPQKKEFAIQDGFTAAGKVYRDLTQLLTTTPGKVPGTFLDLYGREVLPFRERFPCFDSYDALNEHRYYRWFYIFDGSRLAEVYYADERPQIQVTEDVASISTKRWPAIESTWGQP